MFEIVWAKRASNSLKKTLEFWTAHNQSKEYPEKIASAVIESEALLKKNPCLGTKTTFKEIRRLLIRQNFSVFYKVEEKKQLIKIVAFRDNRRKPKY